MIISFHSVTRVNWKPVHLGPRKSTEGFEAQRGRTLLGWGWAGCAQPTREKGRWKRRIIGGDREISIP